MLAPQGLRTFSGVHRGTPKRPWKALDYPQNPDRSGSARPASVAPSAAPRPSLLAAHADCRHALAPLVGAACRLWQWRPTGKGARRERAL